MVDKMSIDKVCPECHGKGWYWDLRNKVRCWCGAFTGKYE